MSKTNMPAKPMTPEELDVAGRRWIPCDCDACEGVEEEDYRCERTFIRRLLATIELQQVQSLDMQDSLHALRTADPHAEELVTLRAKVHKLEHEINTGMRLLAKDWCKECQSPKLQMAKDGTVYDGECKCLLRGERMEEESIRLDAQMENVKLREDARRFEMIARNLIARMMRDGGHSQAGKTIEEAALEADYSCASIYGREGEKLDAIKRTTLALEASIKLHESVECPTDVCTCTKPSKWRAVLMTSMELINREST